MNEKLTRLAEEIRQPLGPYWHNTRFGLIADAIDEINRVQSEVVNSLAARVAAQSELLAKKAEKAAT